MTESSLTMEGYPLAGIAFAGSSAPNISKDSIFKET
jgi:hypothetical protein